MKPDGFTRRSFIRLSTATFMGTALGMTSTTLVGCSDDSSSNTDASASQSIDTQDAIKLHVSDRSFSVDEGPEVAMSTDILSLIPVVASNTIEAAYVDENGEWQREPLGDLGSAIVVHGTLGMLTADGTKGEGSVIVADDANISVLSIGTIERADVEGKVGCLVVLGPADATAQSGASLDHVVVNSHTGIIEKVEDATVGSIHAPKGTDATGEVIESVLQPITAEDEFALTVNGSCLASYGDSSNENDNEWRANFGEDTTSESSQSNDKSASAASFIGSLFAPKTAYADEAEGELQPVDDNSDDADSDADTTENIDPDTDDTNDDTSSDDQDSTPGDPNDPPVDVEYVEPDDPNAEYTPEEGAVEGDSSDYNPSSDDPDAGIPDDAAVPIPYPGLERVDPEAAGANIGEEIAIKLLGKALKGVAKWAGEEIADYAGDKVLDLIFGEVFGDETAEELEKIEAKLDEIDGKLDEIEKGIAQIISQLQKMTYAGQVDTYISTFYTPIKTWIQGIESAAQKYVDDMDKDKRLDAAKEFAEIILTNSDYKCSPLGGAFVDEVATNLGTKILEPWSATSSNLIGAYDNLMVYNYKWEHQGYADRCDYQEMVMAQFLKVVAYAQLALRQRIADTKGKTDKDSKAAYAIACARFQQLFGDQELIADYVAENGSANEACLVDRITDYMDKYSCPALARDASQRYYQVPDHPMLFAANAATVWTWYKDEDQKCTMYDSAGHHVPTIDQYKTILKDYDGSDTPYLDQIFFSEDEGAFGKPEEASGYRHIGFKYPLPYDKNLLGDVVDQYVPVIETNGKTWNCRVTHKYWDFAGWHLKVDKVSFNCVYLLK